MERKGVFNVSYELKMNKKYAPPNSTQHSKIPSTTSIISWVRDREGDFFLGAGALFPRGCAAGEIVPGGMVPASEALKIALARAAGSSSDAAAVSVG